MDLTSPAEPRPQSPARSAPAWSRGAALCLALYGFLVSIGLIGKAFKLFGGGFVDHLIADASNPLIGLVVGVLATSVVQSSSTTTSLVVAMVGGGTMPVATAIPVVMGANIGTSVTNILVSLGHLSRGREFQRAFQAANVHDFFNVIAVIVLFPLQWATNFLGVMSSWLADVFQHAGGLTFASPLKILTKPAVDLIAREFGPHPWFLLLFSLVLMFAALRFLVVVLKGLVLRRVASLFDDVIFKSAGRAMLFGLVVTVLVQSSSITTSLAVPLAAAGLLTLEQIFPYTLGANVGTTITAILAALAIGEVSAVSVAFAHMLFNVCGICVIWPVPAIRRLPIELSVRLTRIALLNPVIPVIWVVFVFYLLPFAVILLLR